MIDVTNPAEAKEIYSNSALNHRSMTVANFDGINYLFLLNTATPQGKP